MRIVIVFSLLIHTILSSQRTIGVLTLEETAYEGYTFFSPFSSTNAYLIDNCGRVINIWERGTLPGLSAYFLENGQLLRTYKPDPMGPFISASNSGGVELVDWDNNTVWSYEWNTSTEISHHDAVYLSNGNILMLTWELVYDDELISMGRDPLEISDEGYMWSEKIIEIRPVGSDDIELVWEWRIRDHYIQDRDSTKQNFGQIGEYPERFDINLPDLNTTNSFGTLDWNHFNAIAYNEDLDQILISTRNSDELWIIDHSTTSEEAATSQGGLYGKGGDFLYRWGNPAAYGIGEVTDQKLFGQHGAHWIAKGLPDAGKILVFNNGNGRPEGQYSTTEIIDPVYLLDEDGAFLPEESEWIYGQGQAQRHYSPYLSNAQRLPNGHTLINAGSPGKVMEIDENQQLVWEYIVPLRRNTPQVQGAQPRQNSVFRVYKYGLDYPGFAGLDLEIGSTLELDPMPLPSCDPTLSTQDLREGTEVYYDGSAIRISPIEQLRSVAIFDLDGRLINSVSKENDLSTIPISIKGDQIVLVVLRSAKANRTFPLVIY